MRIIITCGPAYEPIDSVRRITNHSTGELGTIIANALTSKGYEVICFRGLLSTYPKLPSKCRIVEFTTNSDLDVKLSVESGVDAIFHTAALCDFRVESIYSSNGTNVGKISSEEDSLTLELKPQPKVISSLRRKFPKAYIVGWKYEVEGSSENAVNKAMRQILRNSTDACVVNGPAFPNGFGFCTKEGLQTCLSNKRTLAKFLAEKIAVL